MRYASVCSGIEAPTVAWEKLGWQAQWYSEIEAFPSAVLAHHYPHVPNLGDMTQIHDSKTFQHAAIDLLVGGTPCQSFSVAGLRKGLDDPRGNLMLTFLTLIDRKQPRWVIWENVPGVLSSWSDETEGAEGGIWQTNDFDTFLCGLSQLGYGIAWRILDAQFFGVPQRRRRVFVVGYFGDYRRAAAVLFERHGLQGHPAPKRKTGQNLAPTVSARTKGGGGLGTDFDLDGGLVAGTITSGSGRTRGAGIAPELLIASPLMAGGHSNNPLDENLIVSSPIDANYGKGHGVRGASERQVVVSYRTAGDGAVYESGDRTAALTTGTDQSANVIVYDPNQITSPSNRSNPEPDLYHTLPAKENSPIGVFMGGQGAKAGSIAYSEHTSPTLKASDCGSNRSPTIHSGLAVRRLMPVECERLMGMPDGYTDIKPKGKPTPDGPRYKALGNSIVSAALLWIGQRINLVETLTHP